MSHEEPHPSEVVTFSFPLDMLPLVARWLSPKDILTLAATCHTWQANISSWDLWDRLSQSRGFGYVSRPLLESRSLSPLRRFLLRSHAFYNWKEGVALTNSLHFPEVCDCLAFNANLSLLCGGTPSGKIALWELPGPSPPVFLHDPKIS